MSIEHSTYREKREEGSENVIVIDRDQRRAGDRILDVAIEEIQYYVRRFDQIMRVEPPTSVQIGSISIHLGNDAMMQRDTYDTIIDSVQGQLNGAPAQSSVVRELRRSRV